MAPSARASLPLRNVLSVRTNKPNDLFFNYRNGDIGAHTVTHRTADAIFGAFHHGGEISLLADGLGRAQTFFGARTDAQIACLAFVGVYFYS